MDNIKYQSGIKNEGSNFTDSKKSEKKSIKKVNKQYELIENLKMEIASELGIMEEIQSNGWQSLSPRVSGKIGGLLSGKLKKMEEEDKGSTNK